MRNHEAKAQIFLDGKDPEYGAPTLPIMLNGVTYLPATDFSFITPTDSHGNLHGMLLMRMGIMGMNAALAPGGLRAIAGEMLKVAEEIEACAKAKAETAIARATEKSRK
jgi:hypothetical protein